LPSVVVDGIVSRMFEPIESENNDVDSSLLPLNDNDCEQVDMFNVLSDELDYMQNKNEFTFDDLESYLLIQLEQR
jgi:hypothetical protein